MTFDLDLKIIFNFPANFYKNSELPSSSADLDIHHPNNSTYIIYAYAYSSEPIFQK